MKKTLSLFLVLLLAFSVTGVYGETAEMVTVTDSMGRIIVLEQPVKTVVALTASDCEILYAIGAGEMLIGRGAYCDWPEEIYAVPAVESGAETNIEQIVALNPDLVIMGTMAQTTEQVEQIENAGIPVLVTEALNIASTYEVIRLLGEVTGHETEAAELLRSMQESFQALAVEETEERPTVYFEVSELQYGLWTAGQGSFMQEIAEMMGLKNIFDDIEYEYAAISEEQVLERNPDYIVTISMYWGQELTPVEEILSRAGWETITAVQNKAILNLQNNELSRPGPRLADGAKALYELVYGSAEIE